MKMMNPYLNFTNNCREAMTFYKQCFGGELQLMTFENSPMDVPPAAKNNILHATLKTGPLVLMASDCMPGQPLNVGNNISLSVDCETTAEQDKLFKVLGEKGQVMMPLQDMFWGARFGMLKDQFGINWMLNCDKR